MLSTTLSWTFLLTSNSAQHLPLLAARFSSIHSHLGFFFTLLVLVFLQLDFLPDCFQFVFIQVLLNFVLHKVFFLEGICLCSRFTARFATEFAARFTPIFKARLFLICFYPGFFWPCTQVIFCSKIALTQNLLILNTITNTHIWLQIQISPIIFFIQLLLNLVCGSFSAAKLPLVQIYCVHVKYIKNLQMRPCSFQYLLRG